MAPIKVWRFRDAPKEYQELSQHGGDEDWLALVPLAYVTTHIGWIEAGGEFGCCNVSEYILADGSMVYIGAHA